MTIPEPVDIVRGDACLSMYEYNIPSSGTILSIETFDNRLDSFFEIELSPENVGDMIEYLEYVRDMYLG